MDDIAVWAEAHENKNIFPEISDKEKSYYVDRDAEDTYIMEYSFSNLFNIKEALKAYSGLTSEPFLLKKMAVEIGKNCCINREDADNEKNIIRYMRNEQPAQGILPEFRYEF